jgi:hypothetical protein
MMRLERMKRWVRQPSTRMEARCPWMAEVGASGAPSEFNSVGDDDGLGGHLLP